MTFHDSCNPARAMGLLEEPRYLLKSVCNNFFEMPENTIREQTFCCGGGAGLGNDENMEMRLRGGLPRANAVRYVHEKHGVNLLTCICAIDRAVLSTLMEYWVPEVGVSGVHELVGNALVMKGEKARTTDLRGIPFAGWEGSPMHDGGKILTGLAAFLALALFPVWRPAISNDRPEAGAEDRHDGEEVRGAAGDDAGKPHGPPQLLAGQRRPAGGADLPGRGRQDRRR